MKNVTAIVLAILASIIIYFYFIDVSTKKLKEFKELQIGMPKQKALMLMGTPDNIINDSARKRTIYFYRPPKYYLSDDMKVIVDNKTGKVIELIDPE